MPAFVEAQKQISPWLWVLSVVGFGLALLNTKRIDAMWKKHGQTKWKGLTKPR